LIFKRIEMNGFKSFADPVTIELTEGITCIVGPNGSGKSNISDAIRWVLGEQSPKMLRGGKMEEVIFSGTQSRRPKGMAEVAIVLDNSDGTFPIDFSEVVIGRRMYRSGDSEYRINQTPCRLRDIRELIMDTGMGIEGYSIIGQGKIADIVSNKMESRREIFEEAAGIVKYRTKKEESERKLERASSNLDRVNDIIGEIGGRIGTLEEDSKKAKEYLVLRERYQQVEVNIALKSMESATGKIDAVNQELAELTGRIEEKKTHREDVDARLRQTKAEATQLEEESEAARIETAALVERMHETSSRRELARERLSALAREADRTDDEQRVLEERLEREREAAGEVQAAREEAAREQRDFEEDLREKERIARVHAERYAELEQKLTQEKDLLFELTGRKAAGQSEAESMLQLRGTLARRLSLLDSEQDGSDSEDRAYAEDLSRAESAWSEKDNLRRSAEQAVRDGRQKVEEQSERAAAVERTLNERIASVGRKAVRLKLLEELESAYEGYSGSVRFLMQQNLRGITGVVGDLLQVPKGLEIAVETALGASLSHVVCEDDAVARQAIKVLKDHQAGRLTFLPLQSLRAGRPDAPARMAQAAGFQGIAADRVSVPAGMEHVADYLLGRVVLCDDLDRATAMSKAFGGAFRFVTLQGDVISPSGSITGGSLRNRAGEILSRKGEIQELVESISLEEGHIDLDRALLEEAQRNLADGEAGILESENALRGFERDCAVLESEIQQLTAFAGQAVLTHRRRASEREDVLGEIERVDRSLQELQRTTEGVQRDIQSADQRILALLDDAEQAKKDLAAVTEAETEARIVLSDVAARIRGTDALWGRVEESLHQLSEEIGRKREDRRRIEEEMQALVQASDADSVPAENLEKEHAQLTERLAELQQQRQACLRETDALEEQRLAHEQELYALQLKQREAEVRQVKFETQVETLKQRLWDEFELSHVQAMEFEADEFVMSRALRESREIKERMRALGDVNIGAISEYEQVSQRYEFLTEQQEDLQQAISELTGIIDDTDATIRRQFKESFDAVVDNFEEVFVELFGGGHARLSLADPDAPLESAIEIEAQPPGKKLQNINLLSGGEKAMTAIALMFAVLKAKPTPFCILDEVEAALDDANIDRFARYLRKFQKTQFALITHQKATMEYADVLYGITMPEQGISRVLSLRLGDSFEM